MTTPATALTSEKTHIDALYLGCRRAAADLDGSSPGGSDLKINHQKCERNCTTWSTPQ